MILSKQWLLLSIPIFIISAVLLAGTIASLVRTVRNSVVLSVPLRPEQRVMLAQAGRLALSGEGKRFTGDFAGLTFELAHAETGALVPLEKILFKTETTSLSRVRLELFELDLSEPGPYVLRVRGLDPGKDYADDGIVFTRRFRSLLVLHVLALVALGSLLIGSLVGSGLALWAKPSADRGAGESTGRPPLEERLAQSAAVVRARTLLRAGIPRYRVLATWRGAVPPTLAGSGTDEGLLLDISRWVALGYRPVEGEEIVLFLAPLPEMEQGAPPAVQLGGTLELMPVVDGKVIYAPDEPSLRRELTLEELERVVRSGE